jgi:hypothetical protein
LFPQALPLSSPVPDPLDLKGDGSYERVSMIWLQILGDQKTRDLSHYSGGNPRFVGSDNILEGGRLIRMAHIKKRKKTLLALLHNLDKKTENDMLTDQEINLKHYLKDRLVSLLREEELKWYKRAKVKTLLEGDANTRFFHLVANDKYRKQHIYRLEDDQGIVVSVDNLKRHVTSYYKNLFGTPE